ncbi:DUF3014 domain-containing protein, partial [Xanthomonas campestris pv. campestris]|nr:DUF3014 domain-containing protein [Xanthomonas campestris pv. campestris]
MQSRPSRWPWLLAIPVVIGAGWWLFRGTVEAPNAASTPKPTTVAAAAPTPPAPAAPSAPQHPLPAHPADAADAAIPPLAKSDSAAWEALRALVPDEAALAIVLRDHLIQRAVVMIDNLTQPSMSRRASVLQPVPGELQ